MGDARFRKKIFYLSIYLRTCKTSPRARSPGAGATRMGSR